MCNEFETKRLIREYMDDAYLEGFTKAFKENYIKNFEESFMGGLKEGLVEVFKAISDDAREQGREEVRTSLISALRLYRSGDRTLKDALAEVGFPADFRLQLQRMMGVI